MNDVITLYFDESGQTGTNLLDPDQKYFSVGSTDLSEEEARRILQESFPNTPSDDLKFRKLFRRRGHYKNLMSFARLVGQQPNRFFCYLVDKKFATLVKLIDWSVEPLLSDQGYDWYQDDYGRRWVNMAYFAMTEISGTQYLDEVTALYGSFSDNPSVQTLATMQARYDELAKNGPESLKPFMTLIAEGVGQFQRRYSFEGFSDRNDIHVACVVTSVGWWRTQHEADFEVVHDQSTHFFRRQGMWDLVTDRSVREGVVQVGRKTARFPLRVRTTNEGNSAELASLQICDLIGGFVARTRSKRLIINEKKLLDDMTSAGLGEIIFDRVEPGHEFVDGPPPQAHGPDVVDQIVHLTRRS